MNSLKFRGPAGVGQTKLKLTKLSPQIQIERFFYYRHVIVVTTTNVQMFQFVE